MKLYPKDGARRMLCRYHNLYGAEVLYELEIEPNDEMREMIVNEMARFTKFLQIDNSRKNTRKLGV